MKVRDIMTAAVYTCQPDTDLGTVAGIMWDHDCGFVPVVDASGAAVGLITDRDICMAAATRRLAPDRIAASQAMSQSVRGVPSRRLRVGSAGDDETLQSSASAGDRPARSS